MPSVMLPSNAAPVETSVSHSAFPYEFSCAGVLQMLVTGWAVSPFGGSNGIRANKHLSFGVAENNAGSNFLRHAPSLRLIHETGRIIGLAEQADNTTVEIREAIRISRGTNWTCGT